MSHSQNNSMAPRVYVTAPPRSSGDSLEAETEFHSELQPLVYQNDTAHAGYGASNNSQLLRKIPSVPSTTSLAIMQGTRPESKESSIDFSESDEDSHPTSCFSQIKTAVVFILVIIMSIIITVFEENTTDFHDYIVARSYALTVNSSRPDYATHMKVRVRGGFLYAAAGDYANLTVEIRQGAGDMSNDTILSWTLPVKVTNLEKTRESIEAHIFKLVPKSHEDVNISLHMFTNTRKPIPVGLDYDYLTDNYNYEIVYAAIILVGVYVLITFDLVHRTLAAILGSIASIAVLASINARPTLMDIINWLDFETLTLLFGMMVIVGIFSETGFFDWMALQAYRIAKGRPWPLMTILCVVSAVVSAFLDNVTTVLLLTPVTIRLCEALRLDPTRLLIAEVMFSNIGGTATAVGDPPNVIIVSSKDLQERGVNFSNFTSHMAIGIFFVSFAAYGLLRIQYRKMGRTDTEENYEVIALHREIEVWRRQAYSIAIASKEEATMRALLLQKVVELEHQLHIKQNEKVGYTDFRQNMEDLEARYRIRNKWLLIKCSIVMVVVIFSFFVSSLIDAFHLDLGWIAFLGAVWLLVLADFAEMESLLQRVEWATLIFFAALFALMEALEHLGLMSFIGDQVTELVTSLPTNYQLPVALLAVLWVSAIASSFIDNIPFTTAMIPVVIRLGEHLPILPLVWALAFGACLGGNGTLIGASANVVAAGIAQQHGYGFSFMDFFKIGFPMMLWTTFIAMIYILICHVAIGWNYW